MSFSAKILFATALTLTASAFAVTLEDAQKAYVSGNWKGAAEAFEAVCPKLDQAKRSECALWGVLSRSQTGNSKDFAAAKKRLDSLIFATPDSLPVVSDLYMTRAQFELYLKRADLSVKSLRTAFVKARPSQFSVIYQVCQSLYKVSPIDSVHSLCAEIERAKSGVNTAASSSSTAGSSSSADTTSPVMSSSATAADSAASSSSTAISSSAETVSSFAAAPATPVAAPAVDAAPADVPATPSGSWTLQLGAFSIHTNAEMLVNSLKAKKIEAHIVELKTEDRTLYQVQTGAFASRDAAVEYGLRVLAAHNLEFQPVKKP